jgi:hypothetical protein
LPDFSRYNVPKRGKCTKKDHQRYQMKIKYSKWIYNVPKFSTARSSKIFKNGIFGMKI